LFSASDEITCRQFCGGQNNLRVLRHGNFFKVHFPDLSTQDVMNFQPYSQGLLEKSTYNIWLVCRIIELNVSRCAVCLKVEVSGIVILISLKDPDWKPS
jgi:hypothetical protein